MAKTIAEKILSAHTDTDNFKIGDIIKARVDFAFANDITAPIALKAAGVSCIIAPSFARIFFRNAINIGLPIFESEEIAEQCSEGDLLEVDTVKGTINNLSKNKVYKTNFLPEFIQKVISIGGLKEYVKEEVRRRKRDV